LTIASTGHTITHAPQLMHTGFQEGIVNLLPVGMISWDTGT
jgi:hypothetical protein